MGSALLMFADDNNGSFPGDLSALYPNYVGDYKVFECPSPGGGTAAVSGGTVTSSDYAYQPGLNDGMSSATPIVAEHTSITNADGGRGCLFVTGTIRYLESSEIGTGDGQIDLSAVTQTVGS